MPTLYLVAAGLDPTLPYRLVDVTYEKGTVAITSNLRFSGFDKLMPKPLATATAGLLIGQTAT